MGASIRNDFGKRGDITIVADEGTKTINICGTTLVDDGPDVATLNNRSTEPHTGFNNVVGTPDVDD